MRISKVQKVCEEIIEYLIREGFRLQVARADVEKAIMYVRGVDERTINRWLRALVTFEYLIPCAPYIYRLNPLKTPKLMSLLKDKPQTKIL